MEVNLHKSSFICHNGGPDFILLNPLDLELEDKPVKLEEIKLKDSGIWPELKSQAWSANVPYFFVITKKGIFIGSWKTDEAFMSNHSLRIFEHFFNALSNNKSKEVGS